MHRSIAAFCFFFAAVLVTTASTAGGPEKLLKAFEQFEPQGVVMDKGVAVVVMTQRRVTPELYSSVILSGACFRLLIDPGALDDVKEIYVLNRFGAQGYVFEGGSERCNELNDMPVGKQREIRLLGYTRAH